VKHAAILIVPSAMKSSSFIENWKQGKAHKTHLQCFVLGIQQSVNQGGLLSRGFNFFWHLSNAFSASALKAS